MIGRELKVGEKVKFRGGVWIVTRVGNMGATIIPTEKTKKKFKTVEREVEFESPGAGVLIATNSDIERVEG